VLVRIARAGRLARVLAALPTPAIEMIAEAIRERPTAIAELVTCEPSAEEPVAPSEPVTTAPLRAIVAYVEQRLVPPSTPAEPPAPSPCPPAADAIASAYGGLFYFASLALELDAGEILWKACLPEGRVLAVALLALLAEDDPAPELLGGVPQPFEPIAVTDEQQQEIAVALLRAFVAAAPRCGRGEYPAIVLRFHDGPAGRLLCATPAGSPFAVFAWPAPTPAAAELGLRRFFEVWPHSAAPPLATPPVAELARRMVRIVRERQPSAFVPVATTAPLAAVLAQLAGALCASFEHRIGEPFSASAEELVRGRLSHPARIVLSPQHMTVIMAMSAIDLAVRKAGLDRNPGWLPWLGRSLLIEFEDDGGET